MWQKHKKLIKNKKIKKKKTFLFILLYSFPILALKLLAGIRISKYHMRPLAKVVTKVVHNFFSSYLSYC